MWYPPHQTWTGGYPDGGYPDRGYPTRGVPPSDLDRGYPYGGYPMGGYPRCGTPHWTWMGVPRQGYPRWGTPLIRPGQGMGVPRQGGTPLRLTDGVFDKRRSVCLLRSRRRTFLLLFVWTSTDASSHIRLVSEITLARKFSCVNTRGTLPAA